MKRGARTTAASSGSTLGRARVAAGLRQRDLAELVGSSQGEISAFERNAKQPRYPLAAAIAEALGVTVATFWPTLANAVEVEGRLLDTVIPVDQAVRRGIVRHHGLRLAYSNPDPVTFTLVDHMHRPPFCCGEMFCRHVDLNDPETYRSIGEPVLIAAGGVNG